MKILVLLFVSLAASFSFAKGGGDTHEIFASSTGAVIRSGGDNDTSTQLSAMYAIPLMNQIQLAIEFDYMSQKFAGENYNTTAIFGHGIYNFNSNYADSFFALGGLGFVSSTGDDTEFGLKIGGGKRFALWGNVSLTPMLTFEKVGDNDAALSIIPLSFSIFY